MTLGTDLAPPPAAARSAHPGWRDPRLWVGVAIVAASVVVGARVLAAADDTVTVWAAAGELAPGAPLTADDLEPVRLRFADDADLGAYLPADQPVPADAVLTRGVGAGELVPAAALGDAAASGLLEVPLAVEPEQVSGSVAAGSTVDVFLVSRGDDGGHHDSGEPVLEGASVVGATTPDEGFGTSGRLRLVLAVADADASRFYGLLGELGDPAIYVAVAR